MYETAQHAMAGNAAADVGALYQALSHYGAIVHRDRRLPVPPADRVTVHSRLCGSELTLDACIENGRVVELGYRVRACSLGKAATAIVVQRAMGLEAAMARRVGDQLRAILAGTSSHCDWRELEVFALARDIPARHGSAMLPFEALDQLFARAGASVGPPTAELDVPNHSCRSN